MSRLSIETSGNATTTSTLSASPSQQSYASSNVYDIEPTNLHMKNVALSRKVARAERKLEEFIKNINEESALKMVKRHERLNEKSVEEEKFQQHKLASEEVKERYKFEADVAIENIAQVTADLKYHKRQVELLLPPWVTYLNNALSIVTSTGHRPNWRSVVKKELNTSLEAMYDTSIAKTPTAIIYTLQQLILKINAIKGQKLILSLQQLVSDYISSLPPDSKLGQHSTAVTSLQQQLRELKQAPVPYASGNWSSDLKSLSLLKTTTSMTYVEPASTDVFDAERFTIDLEDSQPAAVTSCVTDIDAPCCPRPTSQSKSRHAPHPDELSAIISQLRQVAITGDIDAAWSIYYYYFPINRPPNMVAVNNKLELLPTLPMYHLIAAAFKNSSIKPNFDHMNTILQLLAQYNLRPDTHMMNITLAACRSSGQWRLALYWFKKYRQSYGVELTSTTTQLLLDCCRHGVDEPGEIFETLRCHGLPRR